MDYFICSLSLSLHWATEATTIYGKGGTSANKFYEKLSRLYPFYRDSVDIEWEGVAVMAAIDLYQGGLIDFMMVDSKFTAGMVEAGLYRLPMVGSALVMVYNLPSLNNTQLVLTTSLSLTE
jgi:ABC-type phosphate transport system substrate-binding protein